MEGKMIASFCMSIVIINISALLFYKSKHKPITWKEMFSNSFLKEWELAVTFARVAFMLIVFALLTFIVYKSLSLISNQ